MVVVPVELELEKRSKEKGRPHRLRAPGVLNTETPFRIIIIIGQLIVQSFPRAYF
jgi:hypothetical protein